MTQDRITFSIPAMPVSANRIWLQNYKTRHTYLNPKYREFCQIVYYTVITERLKMPDDWKYCYVFITLHPKRRIGDADNYNKPISDALTKAGFWRDDKCVADIRAKFGSIDKAGRVDVLIERRETKFEDF